MSLPNAITREDFYLNKIANPSDDHELPDAITRQQHYLKAIAENAGGGGGGGQPFDYSTTERVVGSWIDGKPLYQKTFVVQKTTVGVEELLDLTSLNIESCVQIIGWFINSSGTHNYMPFYTSSSDFAIAYYQGGYLYGYNGGDHTKSSWNVTLQYTKTTDTAGSGTWTPTV